MAKPLKIKKTAYDFPFYQYLRLFYEQNRKTIRQQYQRLTLTFLDFNDSKNATSFLRRPQFEALEMYVFLKEFGHNRPLWQLFDDWNNGKNGFEGRGRTSIGAQGQLGLFEERTAEEYLETFKVLRRVGHIYPNYIFALTMGLGKTVLMATSIFYEFLLANKYPKNTIYCHNALVFAPDKTVLQSLKEIQTFDKSKVIPPQYVNWINTHIQFHFLDEAGMSLNLIDRSRFNIIISNTQKIILKRQHKAKSPADLLFSSRQSTQKSRRITEGYEDLYDLDPEVENQNDLLENQRFCKLTRLEQLGIYVDEAHHAFGTKLGKDMGVESDANSLRVTINELAVSLKQAGTQVVACYNYTGTPYVGNRLLAEVVYSYGLKDAIANAFLKKLEFNSYSNVGETEFLRAVVDDFWAKQKDQRHEGMLPKLAFFATTIDEVTTVVRPALEQILILKGIDPASILVNVGDEKITSNDDIREFIYLDTAKSKKQFIILVGKGKEGWNCRSLFGVALYRKPKSKIFVLQATMRCLRAITPEQQTGLVYLSEENTTILEDELQQNFSLKVEDLTKPDTEKVVVEVRLVPPPVKIILKRISKLQRLDEKPMPSGIDLHLETINAERYQIIHKTYKGIDLTQAAYKEDISYIKNQRDFSQFTLVAEIARYLNKSPLLIETVLTESKEGMTPVLKLINQFNEILYDYIIPRLFGEFYTFREFKSDENYEVELVKEPSNPEGCYRVTAKAQLVANYLESSYAPLAHKSFHLDNYCFDSNSEKQFFWTCLRDGEIEKIWFTGMLTHGQSDFCISYIDPISNTVRNYFPDFLVKRKDGVFVIVEIKASNQMDDEIVQAKAVYAQQLALGSGLIYRLIEHSDAVNGLVAA